MFAHLTLLETPIVWIAFAVGLVLGGAVGAAVAARLRRSAGSQG